MQSASYNPFYSEVGEEPQLLSSSAKRTPKWDRVPQREASSCQNYPLLPNSSHRQASTCSDLSSNESIFPNTNESTVASVRSSCHGKNRRVSRPPERRTQVIYGSPRFSSYQFILSEPPIALSDSSGRAEPYQEVPEIPEEYSRPLCSDIKGQRRFVFGKAYRCRACRKLLSLNTPNGKKIVKDPLVW